MLSSIGLWGSIASPAYTFFLWLANWTFWYSAFYWCGDYALACAMFGAAMFWMIFVRMFNIPHMVKERLNTWTE